VEKIMSNELEESGENKAKQLIIKAAEKAKS